MNERAKLMHPESHGNPRPTVDALYVVGRWLLDLERYADAAAVARAMVVVAPADERGWLALGTCHERIEQIDVAVELYGVGRVMAAPAPRCELARARVLRAQGMQQEAEEGYALAASAAERLADEEVMKLIEIERRTP